MVLGGAFEGDVFQNALYENPYQDENNWIKIRLEGNQSNSYGIGARLEIELDENEQSRKIYKTVNSGGSFGCSPLRQEIGVGQSEQINIRITWPGLHAQQTLENMDVNQAIVIKEGVE